MATKLENLEITSVSLVDEGANQDADIDLEKRREKAPEPKNPGPKKSLAKRLLDFFTSSGVQHDDLEKTLDTVEKAGFNDQLVEEEFDENRMKCCDQICDFTNALSRAFCSSLWNDEIDPNERWAEMSASLDEFIETTRKAIEAWQYCKAAGQFTEDVAKLNDAIKDEGELKAITKARDALTSIIDKSTGVVGKTAGDQPKTLKGAEEMKIDKSKMTEAERAFLDSIEKRYAVEDAVPAAPATGTVPAADGGVAKSAAAPAPQPAPAVQPKAAQAAQAADDGDIYKGINPAIRAELEALKKFKADAEDKELHEVAKRYEILGKKDEDLFPVLKSLKAANEDAYKSFVKGLDDAKMAVEKSNQFGEIGATGTGTMPSMSIAKSQAEGKIDNIAKSYLDKDPSLSYADAKAKAWSDHPEIYAEYEEETNN